MLNPEGTEFPRSWMYVAFYNKTNNSIRVNVDVSFRLIAPYKNPYDCKKQVTLIVKPQGYEQLFAEDGGGLYMMESNVIITDFKLINYSVKEEDYEVPW